MKTAVKERDNEELAEAEEEIKDLRRRLSDANEKIDAFESDLEANDERVDPDVIHRFLDLLNRPVGKLSFTVPTGAQTDRAIIALYDAVGRNP